MGTPMIIAPDLADGGYAGDDKIDGYYENEGDGDKAADEEDGLHDVFHHVLDASPGVDTLCGFFHRERPGGGGVQILSLGLGLHCAVLSFRCNCFVHAFPFPGCI